MGYSTWFFAPGTIATARDPRYTVIPKHGNLEVDKLINFVIFGHFYGL